MYWSEGCRARSKAMGLGSILEGVQVFESPPSHSILFTFCFCRKRLNSHPIQRMRKSEKQWLGSNITYVC